LTRTTTENIKWLEKKEEEGDIISPKRQRKRLIVAILFGCDYIIIYLLILGVELLT
jgi:hypothetical protein